MAATILRSDNFFRDRFHPETLTLTPPLKSRGKSRPNSVSNHNFGPRRRNRSPARFRPGDGRSRSTAEDIPAKNLVMGEVKILKRGETLSSLKKTVNHDRDRVNEGPEVNLAEDLDIVLGSTDRLGPDSRTVQKQISVRNGLAVAGSGYAGIGFSFSPSPNSLPIPGFLTRNKKIV